MDEPIELHDVVRNTDTTDVDTVYEIPAASRDDENEYMKINTLAETMTESMNDRDNAVQKIDKVDVSKPGTDDAAIRRLKIVCGILLALVIISSGTSGALIYKLRMRADATEIKSVGLNCSWGNWTSLSSCSATCGEGTQYQERRCESLNPEFSGQWCSRKEINIQACNIKPCTPVNRGWGDWSQFFECSKLCGGGKQLRNRSCDNPRPSHGGADCSGNAEETRTCNTEPCRVNGGWGDWSQFFECSKLCGGGTQLRNRSCDNPRPSHGGADCSGNAEETRTCNTEPCRGKDCSELDRNNRDNGTYDIYPYDDQGAIVSVYCVFDMDGTWTVIQKRINGSVKFTRSWADYKSGFGNGNGEYWIGDAMTEEGARNSDRVHNGMQFSTIDRDNDRWYGRSCATYYKAGWWYNKCVSSNLNGPYSRTASVAEWKGILWYQWRGKLYSLKETAMMIRKN